MKNIIADAVKRVTGNPGDPDEESRGFIPDLARIRKRARRRIEDGAVTDAYKADREAVVRLLNDATADITSWRRDSRPNPRPRSSSNTRTKNCNMLT
jgi:hypothetical protein